MLISRGKYLDALKIRMNNHLVKVITGIRRCGKSYLVFKIFQNYLLETGVKEDHIIKIELDQRKNREYRDPDKILDYIDSLITDDEPYYILLDEVQMLNEFEEVLNSLLHIDNADVYVTGSNSKFLSKDIITEFRGRGDEVHVYPLSFKEYMDAYNGDVYKGWAEYITYGGLPLIASTIGTLSNPSKIEAAFKSVMQSDISLNTIRQYIEYLKDAFVINEAQRYDVK
jgi:predicted AAA+ superfamily ATPase